jgi:Phage integrase SAM-like domain
MASLHARHSRSCPLDGKWTAPDADGCTCSPSYYVAARDDDGKLVRERVGRNKRDAERARDKIAVQVDEGAYVPQKNIAFNEWGARWLESLERKQTTVNDYRSTIKYATDLLGSKPVRRIGTENIARFNQMLSETQVRQPGGKPVPLSASTRAKHLRVLGACLNSAVSHKYAASNPIKSLPKSEKPRPQRKEGRVLHRRGAPAAVRRGHTGRIPEPVPDGAQDRDARGRADRAALGRARLARR